MGLEPGTCDHSAWRTICRRVLSCGHWRLVIKLLGFKDESELAFEDNIKHSFFIYPDEMVRLSPHSRELMFSQYVYIVKAYSGSKRTFSALLKSMISKKKIGIALALTRRNSSPTFCAMLPQASSMTMLVRIRMTNDAVAFLFVRTG
jgi:hypothetical protein